jgi:hypothetical protein
MTVKIYSSKSNAQRGARRELGLTAAFDLVQEADGGGWYWIDTSEAAAVVAGAENDAEAQVVGADVVSAPEPEAAEPVAQVAVPPMVPLDIEALVLAMGAAVGAKKAKGAKAKKPVGQVAQAMAQAQAGVLPPVPAIPDSNASARKHAARLLALAEAADLGGLEGYFIGGTNTYSRLLRGYRGALLVAVAASPLQVAA